MDRMVVIVAIRQIHLQLPFPPCQLVRSFLLPAMSPVRGLIALFPCLHRSILPLRYLQLQIRQIQGL